MHSNTRSFQRARFEVWIVWKFGFEIHFSGNHVKNHATLWPNLQDCKISSRAEIPKLDPSVAIKKEKDGIRIVFKQSVVDEVFAK